jgi:hypothetical protein
MHMQVRTIPSASPPDVEKLLRRLKEGGVDLAAVGGSNVEFGGEFAFVPKDGQEDKAFGVLERWGYQYRALYKDNEEDGLTLCEVSDVVGGLHDCLATVAEKNLLTGRIIRDILIGVPDDEDRKAGTIPVHVYSEQVRTQASVD